jgi:hypothetical protein
MKLTPREIQLARALQKLLQAHEDLMPLLENGSVPDYTLQNEAPLEALAALKGISYKDVECANS